MSPKRTSNHTAPAPKTSAPALAPSSALPPLGAHCSTAGGFLEAVRRARAIGATAMQMFLKNPTQWRGAPITDEDAAAFAAAIREAGLRAAPLAHSAYLINLAAPEGATARRSVEGMIEELERAARLGVPLVIVHPGAHMGQGEEVGLRLVAERINYILSSAPGPAAIGLETTAGQGTCLGARFEHLAGIIERVEDKSRVAACLDTCHIFTAGYDLRTPECVQATLDAFGRTVGLDRLRAIHVNDSKTPFASHRDRHAHIGQGEIGEAAFAALIRDPRLAAVPFIIETPKGEDLEEDRVNLAALRRLAGIDKGKSR